MTCRWALLPIIAATPVTGHAKVDTRARQAEYEAYKRRCNEAPPPGLDPRALARWKLRRNRDCREWIQANCPDG